MTYDYVWVFNGLHHHFPSAVFTTLEKAEAWINEHDVQGTLTAYPLDVSAYDWAIENQHFKPSDPKHSEANFMANFSHASQDHYHYVHDDND
ncbi:MAG: hypothetical protein AAFV93_12065 [Chloroflexota bacterium]